MKNNQVTCVKMKSGLILIGKLVTEYVSEGQFVLSFVRVVSLMPGPQGFGIAFMPFILGTAENKIINGEFKFEQQDYFIRYDPDKALADNYLQEVTGIITASSVLTKSN